MCQILKMRLPTCTEYNLLADTVKEDNGVMHWKGIYSWCQDADPNGPSNRAVRGYHSARRWDCSLASFRYVSVGFRPALEPLGSEPCFPNALIGKNIRLYGPGWAALEGHLLDADDYDFTLVPTAGAPTRCFWASKAGDNLVVSRDSILWFTEA